jgi:hypothetical protein
VLRRSRRHSDAFSVGAATPAVGVVVLTNAAPVGAAEAIADAIIDDSVRGARTQDWGDVTVQARSTQLPQPPDLHGRGRQRHGARPRQPTRRQRPAMRPPTTIGCSFPGRGVIAAGVPMVIKRGLITDHRALPS